MSANVVQNWKQQQDGDSVVEWVEQTGYVSRDCPYSCTQTWQLRVVWAGDIFVLTDWLSSDTMGGGEMPYKVPDWKIYQVGNHTPELQQVQRMLSSLGLKVSQDTERGDVEAMLGPLDPQRGLEVWQTAAGHGGQTRAGEETHHQGNVPWLLYRGRYCRYVILSSSLDLMLCLTLQVSIII